MRFLAASRGLQTSCRVWENRGWITKILMEYTIKAEKYLSTKVRIFVQRGRFNYT